MDHLRELRRRVVWIVLIVVAGAIVGWIFYNNILELLKRPYCSVPYQQRMGGMPGDGDKCRLVFMAPLDGLTARLKISFMAGAVVTGPLWLYQIWAFVAPGLRRKEKKYTRVFVAVSTVLFAAGVGLAYVVLWKGLRILIGTSGNGTTAILTINSYISFVMMMLVAFGVALELPLLLVMANFVGVLPAKWLRKSWRIMVFLIFLFAAIATPTPDPFTMTALAVPIVVLYLSAVWIATAHDKRKAARKAAARAAQHLSDEVPSVIEPARTDAWSDTT
ncbi:MAG: twin-arginine translocase subunit TatC [Actinomycetia bacterium]|nr:twin-arginine translocase subunit TatC [Actinomycetes bacterium]